MSKKPNILFFLTDDQRFDTIHALGNDEIQTPNLDEFVKNSIAFTHGHIMGGTCGAVCMPSRAMMQTGRTVFTLHGDGKANGSHIPPEHITMPEYLKENGYFTQHVGKWHQDKESFNRSYTDAQSIFCFGNSIPGRNSWYGAGGHYAPVLMDYDETGKYELEHAFQMGKGMIKKELDVNVSGNMHSTDIFCDTALNFLENYDKEEPFYLYLALVAPHDPRNAPEKYEEMYSPDNVSTPENFLPDHPFDNGDIYDCRDELLEWFPRREYAIRRHISDYYSMISHIDARFGDVIKQLKDKGIYDDTIIIVAGDNGLALGQHGLLGKQNVYEHSIRVPLMVKPAGKFEPKTTDSYAYLADIFPTVCDMIDIEIPSSVTAQSFAPILTGEKEKVREDLLLVYRNLQRAYKNDRYKLIEYFVGENRYTQLFDLKNDPKEITDLSQNPEYAEILLALREKLHEKQVENQDPMVTCSKEKLAENIW
ncbi:MAG: sulfatase-like hydrolase/transferase [Clostridia bacterium]